MAKAPPNFARKCQQTLNHTAVKNSLQLRIYCPAMGGATIGAGGYILHFCVTWGQGGQVQNYIDVKQSAVKVCFSSFFAKSRSLSSLSSILIGYIRYASMRNTCHATSI
jgi:hypothetical protein